jgi:MFS family permease
MIETKEFKGYASIVVLSGFLQNFMVINIENYWGVFQEYYVANNTFNTNVFNISLVGSLAVGLAFGLSLIAEPIIKKLGYKKCLIFGTIICNLGILLTSWVKELWQIYLTLSLMFGIGGSFIEVIVSSVPALWFKKSRSLAMGICSAGAGIGGLVISLMSRKIIDDLGIEWALRIIAIMQFILGLISTILMKQPVNEDEKSEIVHNNNNDKNDDKIKVKKNKKIFNLKLFKKNWFILWFISSMLFSFAFMNPFTFIPSYSTYLGMSPNSGSIFVSVASGTNALGKIIIGILSDKYGEINVGILCFLMSGLSCLFIWSFSITWGGIFAFSFIYGLFSGAFFTLMSPITLIITGINEINAGIAIILSAISIGTILSTPISSIILEKYTYIALILYTGFLFIGATIFLIILKFKVKNKLI